MKKQTLILMALSLTLAMPTFAQKAMTKKEIAEKEKTFKALQHPWKGKRVAYFGDSITDPRNNGSTMSKLKQMYPNKQIVLMTPIHRAIFDPNDKNIQPDENYENMRGLFLDEYVNAVKEAGNVWAVPVIDLNSVSGLFPLCDEGAKLFKSTEHDRLHPNDAGHERMAKTIMYQLSALPCTF